MIAKIWEITTYVCLVITLLFYIWCVGVAIVPIDVIDFRNDYQKVLNPNHEVKTGEKVRIEVDYCKYFPLEAEITNHLEDSIVYDLLPEKSDFDTGCRKSIVEITVPKAVPVGERVRIRREIYYKISPFTEIHEMMLSEYFVVTE